MDSLTLEMTRALASDDFESVLSQLPVFCSGIERQLAAAADDGSRENILTEALATNRRWLSLAQCHASNIRQQLRMLEAQSRYSAAAEARHIVETTA
jgi:hypothetical protein